MVEAFGLSKDTLDKIKQMLALELKSKKKYHIYVFGSRANGKQKKYSDLDLWIETDPVISSDEVRKIREVFDESDLPIKVDIVTPENCLPEYKEQILTSRRLWFERG